MQRTKKLKRSIKGISPIISVLLLIAIAVVASLVVYAWVIGYLNTKTSTTGDSIQIQSFTSQNGLLTIYVQNTGQGVVHLNHSGSVYVNSSAETINQFSNGTQVTGEFPIAIGKSVGIVTSFAAQQNSQVTIKVVTAEGTFIQTSGAVQGSDVATHFVVSSGTSQAAGTPFSVKVTACYSSGGVCTTYTGTVHFTSNDAKAVLPANYQFTAADAGVHTFTVTLETAAASQSVTATDTVSSITGSQGSIKVAPAAAVSISVSGPAQVTAGQTATFTAKATDQYSNSWDVSNAATWSGGGGSWSLATLTAHTAGTFTVTATDGVSGTAPLTVTPASAATFTVSGFTTPATAGTAGSVTVTAMDQYGNVATGYSGTVEITSSDGKAVLPKNSVLTNGAGPFGVTLVTAGTQSITAVDTSNPSITGSQTGILVNPSVAVSYSFGNIGTQTAGTPFTLTITAQDAYGNTATGYGGTAALSDSSNSLSPVTAAFTAGVWTSKQATIDIAGLDAITAQDSASTIITQSGLFTVNPGNLAKFSVSAVTGQVTAGTAFTVTITAQDANGNTVPSYIGSPTATLSDLSGTINPTALSSGWVNGVWTYTLVSITKAYTNDVVNATDGTATGISTAFNVVAQTTPYDFVVSTPTNVQAGVGFTLTVAAVDAYNNTITAYSGSTTAILSDTSTTISPTSLSAGWISGVWTGTSMNITKAMTGDVITAADTTNNLKGQSSGFTISPGVPIFSFGTITTPQTAGTAFSITITAKDAYGNPESNYAGATLQDSSGSISPASTGQFNAAGSWTGSVIVTKTFTNDVITATDSASGSNAISGKFTVNPAALASFTISAIGNPQTAGTGFSITITASDQYGNGISNYAGATLKDNSGSINTTSTGAFNANGVWTGAVKINTANTNDVITVTDSVSGVITVQSNTFNVNIGSLDHFSVAANTPETAGTPFSVTVTAKDAGGNTITTWPQDPLTFSDSTGTITLATSGAFNNGVWTGTVKITEAYTNDVITATDASTGQYAGTYGTVTVTIQSGGTSDPATKLVFIAGTAQSIAVGTVSSMITVQLQDANGNPVNAGTGGVIVSLSSNSGTGTFYSGAGGTGAETSVTIASGSSSASFYYEDTTAGAWTITGAGPSGSGLASATTSITINDYTLTFSGGTAQKLAPGVMSQAITITGNAGGIYNTITVQLKSTSSTGKFYSSATGGTPITSIQLTIFLGTGSVTVYYIDTTVGTPTLTASSLDYASATTQFTIYQPALKNFTITAQGGGNIGTQATNTPFSITITAKDQQGNTLTSYTGTNTLSASSGSISPTGTGAFTNGVWTGSVTLNTASPTMTISTSGGGATGTSNQFNVYTPNINHFTVTASSYTQTAGTAFTITITAIDQNGNTFVGWTGTNQLTVSSGTISPTTATVTAGVGTASVTLKKAGSVTISTSGDGATGTSNTFTINPGALASFTMTGYPATIGAGNNFPNNVIVTAYDAYGNVATNFRGTVSFTSTDPQANLPNDYTFTNGDNGAHSFAGSNFYLATLGSQTITVSSGTVSLISSTITVTAGALSQYAFGSIGTQTTGVAFTVTVKQEDSYGNVVTTQGSTPVIEVYRGTATSSGWTFSNGVWTGQVTITYTQGRNGEYLYVNGYQYANNSPTFTLLGSLYQFGFSHVSTQNSGIAFSVTITAEDQNGNTITSYSGSQTLSLYNNSGSGTPTLSPTTVTFANGVATPSVTITCTGTHSVYLYISGFQSLNPSNNFSV